MTVAEREKFPEELRARITETCQEAILAGCTADETIALAKETVQQWVENQRAGKDAA